MALACESRNWTCDGASIHGGHPVDAVVDWVYDEGGWEHIALHDPARVLAEVATKRRILDWLDSAEDWMFDKAYGGQPDGDDVRKLLALPYADQPGYQEEWRPSPT